jgi:hypothetical protein
MGRNQPGLRTPSLGSELPEYTGLSEVKYGLQNGKYI